MDGMGTLNLVVSLGVSCSLGVICKEKCISRSIRFFPMSSCTTRSRGGTVQISELNFAAVEKTSGPSKAWVHRQPQAMIDGISPLSANIYPPKSILYKYMVI